MFVDKATAKAAKTFGQRLRAARVDAGYSQEAFAHASGVDRSYVGQVERGEKNITLGTMLRLTKVLEVGVADLVVDL